MSMTNVSTNLAQFHFDQLTSATTNQSLRGASVTDSDRLRQAAEGFEALFLQKMMQTARTSTLGDDLMGSSAVDKTRDLFDMEMTQSASRTSSLGIADAIYRQMAPIAGIKE